MKETYEKLLEALDSFWNASSDLQEKILGPHSAEARQIALSRAKHELGEVEQSFLAYKGDNA